MATLNEVLQAIAEQLNLNGHELIAYAAEDATGGYHIDETLRSPVFGMGSIWGSEGQIIYALVRALKPETVVEIGGWVGCGATHIASALRQNSGGKVVSVDNGVGGAEHGKGIPDDLRKYVTLVSANGEDWLAAQKDNSLDMVFEDADHSTPLVKLLSELAMQKLEAGGILLNHDASHDFAFVGGEPQLRRVMRNGAEVEVVSPPMIFSDVGKAVRDGLQQASITFQNYITEESDCGLSVAQKQGAIYSSFEPDRYSEKKLNGDDEPYAKEETEVAPVKKRAGRKPKGTK